MKIGELKAWLGSIPAEFDELELVYRKLSVHTITNAEKEEENGEFHYALDAPIVSGYIDEENKECCLIDEESRLMIIKMNEQGGEPESTNLEKKE